MDFWTGAEDLAIWGFVVRAAIIYVYIFLMVKVLGQRSIGTLDPLDFIFGVIIGDVVGEPLSSGDLPLAGPMAAALLIAALHWGLTVSSLHLPKFRRVVEEEPLIVLKHGKIIHTELKKAKMTTDQLLSDLRLQSASDLNEVDYAVLEPNGQLSVIKKTKFEPLTPMDTHLNPAAKGYPSVMIADGHIIQKNIESWGSIDQFFQKLSEKGYESASRIFLCTVNEAGEWYISEKE
ncbi:uncharacterized membrane protein YcaP (DUF421 family) [Salsuginibacillus halophilus]|uniref:Uncharacterized membrane protein YcaP (DUF421 family) n=1 Tax=Salsuginibacillus halophilus TaxID=517424 RepID=A0A2P8HYR3_9BACI|nr:DUF421 domain-containing protein [Salsuginibacillus halophilus]PSL51325.1 uncharacterized membrane protein YcaP (DUF421 family) [Salsuginibacillus halophilus]